MAKEKRFELLQNYITPEKVFFKGIAKTSTEWNREGVISAGSQTCCGWNIYVENCNRECESMNDWFKEVEEKEFTESEVIAILRMAMRLEEVCGSNHKAEKYLLKFKNGER